MTTSIEAALATKELQDFIDLITIYLVPSGIEDYSEKALQTKFLLLFFARRAATLSLTPVIRCIHKGSFRDCLLCDTSRIQKAKRIDLIIEQLLIFLDGSIGGNAALSRPKQIREALFDLACYAGFVARSYFAEKNGGFVWPSRNFTLCRLEILVEKACRINQYSCTDCI